MSLKKYSAVCIFSTIIVLGGCSGGVPEATSVNCQGRGLEMSLNELRNDEEARQAFLDKCEALK